MISNIEFWKLRASEALYLVSSRVTISVIVLLLITRDQFYTTSIFLFFFFLFRSLSGMLLAGKVETFQKRSSLLVLSLVFSFSSFLLHYLNSQNLINIYTLSVIALVLAVIDSLYSSIIDSYIPLVVEKEQLDDAYRNTSMIQSFIDLFGITLGMIGVELIGIQNVLLTVIALSIVTTLIIWCLKNLKFVDNVKSYELFSVKKSILLFFHYKFEPRWALLSLVTNMVLLPFSMMVIPYYVSSILNESPVYIGIIEASASVGVLLGSIYVHKRVTLLIGNSKTVSVAFAMIGISLILMALLSSIMYWVILASSIGVALVLSNVTIESKRAELIPQEHRVKIQTIHNSFINLANPIGFLIIGTALTNYSYSLFMVIGGVVIFTQAFIVFTIPNFKYIIEGKKGTISYIDLYGEP